MSIEDDMENLKIAVALRTARAAAGINQQELADALNVEKSTIARIETLEIQPKAETYMKALKYFKGIGVDVDSIYSNDIIVKITQKSLLTAKGLLADDSKRRSDRKTTRVLEPPPNMEPRIIKEPPPNMEPRIIKGR